MEKEENYLGIPIYLDTNTLLDLLASMEDGFSAAKKIVTRDVDSTSSEISAEGNFGIKILTLLKIGFGASGSKTNSDESGEEQEEERVHTYGSLMNRLIENLYERKLIKTIKDEKDWDEIEESDFIIIQGKFIPNPLVNSLKIMNNLFDMIIRLGKQKNIPPFNNEIDPLLTKDMTKKEKNAFIKNLKKTAEKQLEEMGSLMDMIGELMKDLEDKNFQKYVIELKHFSGNKIVCYLFNEFIRDRAGVELPYGQFKMLGKVVRKIEGDDSIDLLQGSVLGLNDEIISGFKQPLEDLKIKEIPELFTKVKSPALQVIPIAIFI